jgi:hypothetical protein
MSHPIFSELPERYHDRVIVDAHDNVTITVDTGDYDVPVIYDVDRHAMGLPCGLHRDRRDPETTVWPLPGH